MRIVPLLFVCGGAAGCHGRGPVMPPPNVPATAFAPYTGAYRLPVEGRWHVHRTHYDLSNDQGLAVDLVVDQPHPAQTPDNPNNAFPSYGLPIVADGPGVVAIAVDGNLENVVGSGNPYEAHGNFVVIDHRNGEFSLFAHLIPGSLRVRAGQVVGMGQTIGLCGNSGHSSMPHLHYQIMDNVEAWRAHPRTIRHLEYLKNGAHSSARMEAGDVIEAIR